MNTIHRHRLVWALLAAMCVTIGVVFLFIFGDRDQVLHPETGYPFPSLSNIAKVEAIDVIDYETSEVRSFEIPRRCWEEVLAALNPSEQDPSAKKMEVFGRLNLDATDKPTVVVILYRQPGNVGEFSTGPDYRSAFHNYYRGGNTKQLQLALKRAYSESQHVSAGILKPESAPTPN